MAWINLVVDSQADCSSTEIQTHIRVDFYNTMSFSTTLEADDFPRDFN